MANPTLFVVAAGSGGHIIPAIQCAQQWHEKNPTGSIIFFTGTSELEKKIFRNYPFISKVIHLSLPQFSRRRWWLIPWIALRGIVLACTGIGYNLSYRPEKIISTGGLLALPFCLATRCCRRRVEVYNLDVIPGKAVRALLPFAHVIYTTFPQAQKKCCAYRKDYSYKCVTAPYPLRFDQSHRNTDRNDVITRINTMIAQRSSHNYFEASRKTIFVLGGSQGSLLLNDLIKKFVEQEASGNNIQIIHQTGAFQEYQWINFYAEHHIPALTFSYDERVHEYYVLADVILCRAGAGTLFEVAFFNKPCIVIPLVASTTDHQVYNARAMAEQYPELFTVIEQHEVNDNPDRIWQALKKNYSLSKPLEHE